MLDFLKGNNKNRKGARRTQLKWWLRNQDDKGRTIVRVYKSQTAILKTKQTCRDLLCGQNLINPDEKHITRDCELYRTILVKIDRRKKTIVRDGKSRSFEWGEESAAWWTLQSINQHVRNRNTLETALNIQSQINKSTHKCRVIKNKQNSSINQSTSEK